MSLEHELENQSHWFNIKKIIPWLFLLWILLFWRIRRDVIVWYFGSEDKSVAEEEQVRTPYTVRRWDISIWLEWEWSIQGDDLITIGFEVGWRITEINKKPWDKVTYWEQIAKVTDEQYRIDLQKAQNALAQSKSNLTKNTQPLANNEVNQINKQLEIDKLNYEEQILKLENEIEQTERSLKDADFDQFEQITKLENDLLKVDNTLQEDIELYKEQLLKLDNDIIGQDQSIQDLSLKLSQLRSDLTKESTDNDLDLLQSEEALKLTQKETDLYNALLTLHNTTKQYLLDIDYLLWITLENSHLNDGFENNLSARNTSIKRDIESRWRIVNASIQWISIQTSYTQESLIQISDVLLWSLEDLRPFWDLMTNLFINTVDWVRISQSQIDQYRNEFSNSYNSLINAYNSTQNQSESVMLGNETLVSTLDSSTDQAADKITTLNQQIASAQQDYDNAISQREITLWEIQSTKDRYKKEIENKWASSQIDRDEIELTRDRYDLDYKNTQDDIIMLKSELSLAKSRLQSTLEKATIDRDVKLNPLSTAERYTYELQVTSSDLGVQEKELQLLKTSLKSPVDGVIISLSNNVWEEPSNEFVTIATDANKFVEVYIEEDEVNRLEVGQKVLVTPDVLEDVALEWEIFYVSAFGETDNNGIVTYQVLASLDDRDPNVRTSMNVTVNFIAKSVNDVIIVPLNAVFPHEWSPSVRLQDWTIQKVLTWLSDGKETEVISWIDAWEIILIGS